jgi:drug/metabolite transporter (DMT)-like permease
MKDTIILLLGIIFGSFGANLLRRGMMQFNFSNGISFNLLANVIFNPAVFIGLFLYIIPTVINMYLLSKYSVSLIQPLLSLTYVLTPFIAFIFFKEEISLIRIIGICIIITGVIFVAKS